MAKPSSTGRSTESWTNWQDDEKLRLLARLRTAAWEAEARTSSDCPCPDYHSQLPPPGDWRVWYLRGGRGSGKTRTGAETLASWILGCGPLDDGTQGEWGIIAPTFGDARDVCIEGRSGLLKALGGAVANWNRSIGELFVRNGARVYIDGADDGALRVQGKNLRAAWCDEVGLWRSWHTAWNVSLFFAVRMAPGLIVATGTPKAGHELVRTLLEDPMVAVSHMRTIDNAANLDAAAVAELHRRYEGTRLGRQELEGEWVEDVEGALWSAGMIDRLRESRPTEFRRIVVGVDPVVSSGEAANEAGIVVAGVSALNLEGYVLDDRTVRGSPERWAREVVDAYHDWSADCIVAERNQGGELVASVLRHVDPAANVKLVHAAQGKRPRAEPIAALYEQGRVHHCEAFEALEAQMTSWTPDPRLPSPDRMDALVWALTELFGQTTSAVWGVSSRRRQEPVYRTGDLVLVGRQYIDEER